MKNYYDTLGVKSDASKDEIRDAFRKLVKEKHPDVCKEKGAEDKFKLIQEAHDVIGDVDKRREYDLSIVQEKADREPEDLMDLLMSQFEFTQPRKKSKSKQPKQPRARRMPKAGVPECDEIPDGMMPDDSLGGIL